MGFMAFKNNLSSRRSGFNNVHRGITVCILLSIVLAYQPAVGDGTGFTLPYTNAITNNTGSVIDLANNGTGPVSDTIDAFTAGSEDSAALYGNNFGTGYGVIGQSDANCGVYGNTNNVGRAGLYGTNSGGGAAIIGLGDSAGSPTGYFFNNNAYVNAVGLQGQCNAGLGVVGYGRVGVYGTSSVNGGYAGYFQGNVQVTGTLSAAAKNFKIDHPSDPAHKYLVHASVESSEQLNTYSGNVTLDSDGKATVQMPEWFEAENGDFRYGLTCVGGYAPVYVAQELQHNRFAIAGGKPNLKVSWQVSATRQDAYARSHPLLVEQAKSESENGKYLNPEDFGKPASAAINPLPPAPQAAWKPGMETATALSDVQITHSPLPAAPRRTLYKRASRARR